MGRLLNKAIFEVMRHINKWYLSFQCFMCCYGTPRGMSENYRITATPLTQGGAKERVKPLSMHVKEQPHLFGQIDCVIVRLLSKISRLCYNGPSMVSS